MRAAVSKAAEAQPQYKHYTHHFFIINNKNNREKRMKNFKHFVLAAIAGVFALTATTSCSDDDNNGDGEKLDPAVTVTIADGTIETEKATFTVTPSAETGAWYATVYPAAEAAAMTDAQVVSTLTSATASPTKPQQGTQTLTYANLAQKTAYTVVAFGFNGKEASEVVRHEFTTAEEKPEQVASQYFDVDYWGDVYHKGYENFIVYFGDAPHESVNIKGMGTIYTLSIYNKTKAGSDFMPQEGEYTLTTADEPSDFCIEQYESQRYKVTEFNEDGTYSLKSEQLKEAKATIKKNADGTWTLDAVIVDPDGVKKEFTYTGAVNVKDRSFKGYTGPTVDEDLDFTADYTPGYTGFGKQFEIMDGGDPNADDASWFNRNRLTIYLPAANSDQQGANVKYIPPVGTFQVTGLEAPGNVLRGEYADLGGGAEGPEGTYYYKYARPSFKQYYAFMQAGTVTITQDKDDSSVYTVKCDFTTEQGHKLTATYTGTFPTTFASAAAAKMKKHGIVRTPRK